MNDFKKVKEMLKFCEDGHDIDGTPQKFLLRSFAVCGKDIEEMKKNEHLMRIEYLKECLRNLENEDEYEGKNPLKRNNQKDGPDKKKFHQDYDSKKRHVRFNDEVIIIGDTVMEDIE